VFAGDTTAPFLKVPFLGDHVGPNFDRVGTFGFGLVVTGDFGVRIFDKDGNVTASYKTPDVNAELENSEVAPLSYAPCPGCLFMVTEPKTPTLGSIWVIHPGAPDGTMPEFFATGPVAPEAIHFPTENACTNNGIEYYASGYSIPPGNINSDLTSKAPFGAIFEWTKAQLDPYVGKFLVADESTGTIFAYNGPNALGGAADATVFSNTGAQLEGQALVACPSSPPEQHHFDCYEVPRSNFPRTSVSLIDRFGSTTSDMTELKRVCAPADKNNEDPSAVSAPEHMAVFTLDNATGNFSKGKTVNIKNQFGILKGDIGQPIYLLAPSSKDLVAPPLPLVTSLPSLQCYRLNNVTTVKNVKGIHVNDQFLDKFGGMDLDLDNRGPWQLCVPASVDGKDVNAPQNPNAQLCYKTNNDKLPFGEIWIFINTPFGAFPALLTQYDALCVPSTILP